MTFTLPGFNTVKREGIQLEGSFAATVNADMRVGALEETITVEALRDLPMSRHFGAVAVLVPGVIMSGGSGQNVGGTAMSLLTDGTMQDVAGRLTWQASPRNKFNVFWDEQSKRNGFLGVYGDATRSPDADLRRDTPINRVSQASWSSPRTNRLLLEATVGQHALRVYHLMPVGWNREMIGVVEQAGIIPGLAYRECQELDYGRTRTNVGLDLYNALNANPITAYNQTFGAAWLLPQQVMPARFIKLSFQVDF